LRELSVVPCEQHANRSERSTNDREGSQGKATSDVGHPDPQSFARTHLLPTAAVTPIQLSVKSNARTASLAIAD
jgi:hypothetical protein